MRRTKLFCITRLTTTAELDTLAKAVSMATLIGTRNSEHKKVEWSQSARAAGNDSFRPLPLQTGRSIWSALPSDSRGGRGCEVLHQQRTATRTLTYQPHGAASCTSPDRADTMSISDIAQTSMRKDRCPGQATFHRGDQPFLSALTLSPAKPFLPKKRRSKERNQKAFLSLARANGDRWAHGDQENLSGDSSTRPWGQSHSA
ncbi:hypothetical protein ACOMHN_023154 [Nucella lapillus]